MVIEHKIIVDIEIIFNNINLSEPFSIFNFLKSLKQNGSNITHGKLPKTNDITDFTAKEGVITYCSLNNNNIVMTAIAAKYLIDSLNFLKIIEEINMLKTTAKTELKSIKADKINKT